MVFCEGNEKLMLENYSLGVSLSFCAVTRAINRPIKTQIPCNLIAKFLDMKQSRFLDQTNFKSFFHY